MSGRTLAPRSTGGIIGLIVGGVIAGLSMVFGVPDPWVPPANSVAIGAVLGGSVGGWLVGPLAWRARTRLDWSGVIALLAFVAIVIGDLVVVSSMIAESLVRPSAEPPTGVLALTVVGFYAFVVGLAVVGPFVAPVTLVAATIWSAGMYVVRRGLEG